GVLRGGGQQAPAAGLLDEGGVVHLGDEAEQGEGEPVLAAGLAVAAAGVTAQLREDRHHLVGEVDRQGDVAARGRDRQLRPLVAVDGGDLGGAVGQRDDPPGGGDADDGGVADLVLDVAG